MKQEFRFTHAFVKRSLGGLLTSQSGPDQTFQRISTDSRLSHPQSLFVALKGDNFDGHDYLQQAIENGATGLLIQQDWALAPLLKQQSNLSIYRVQDPLQAIRSLAAHWRNQFSIPIFAVGGSVGKTTSKEILASLLSGRFEVIHKTSGSQNGFLGIPLTLLGLNERHQAAVIEIGIDAVQAMREHAELVKPDFSLMTKIAPEHMEFLKTMDTVATEECQLLEFTAERGGVCAINLDDTWLEKYFKPQPGQKHIFYTFNQNKKLDQSSPNLLIMGSLDASGRTLHIKGSFGTFSLPMVSEGQHNAINLLGAVAMAMGFGLSPDEIRKGWLNYKPLVNRSNVLRLSNGPIVIRDEYNASPASVEAALELMKSIASASGKRIVCLGDMLELGESEEQYHRNLVGPLKTCGTTHLLTLGKRAAWTADEFRRSSGSKSVFCESFMDHEPLAEQVLNLLTDKDILLIKGSRGMRLEKVLPLLANQWPELASKI